MDKPTATLKHWRFMTSQRSLTGEVFGHPHFFEGQNILTSTVLRIDFESGTAETLNTIYTLEK